MRLFIGVPIPIGLRPKIGELQKELYAQAPRLNYTPPENLHLTIKFLGEVSQSRLGMVKEVFDTLQVEPFTISLRGLGVFPSPKYVSVIWVGVDNGRDEFVRLMRQTEEKLGDVRQETKEPHPHLTIIRVTTPAYTKQISAFVVKHKDLVVGSLQVNEVVLYQSVMTSRGIQYKKLASKKLE